ncbi:MAG: phosphatidate cytidylyltransferase [Rhodocyclaceae bacterium]|nr:phosphatidate cytidylyltransferase [Rhodocyclaceae bacterium]MBX3669420.1 phosphatidate cytidylyltransferase [Rhodocyclaceae bacterium]
MSENLKKRIITAIVLLALVAAALTWLPPLGWLGFAALIAGLAGWEWGALAGHGAGLRVAYGLFCALAVLLLAAAGLDDWRHPHGPLLPVLYGVATAFWLLVVPLWLKRRWPAAGTLGSLTGLVVIVPSALALAQLRWPSASFLLAAMALVWVADIAAYFSGRAFGRRKLAPAISPGKTWEGVYGALVAVNIYGALVLRYALPPAVLDKLPSSAAGWALGLFAMLALTALSIIGDLFESLLKRQAGIKDSSQLLPGHGGVLDRIDSQTSTLPLVALVLALAAA